MKPLPELEPDGLPPHWITGPDDEDAA